MVLFQCELVSFCVKVRPVLFIHRLFLSYFSFLVKSFLETHDDLPIVQTSTKLFHRRGWLGQHGPCCNTNTRPSFLNTRPNFWFSLKAAEAQPSVWKAWSSVWKAWLYFLRQNFNLHFINNTCSYSLRHWARYILLCCLSYIWKIPKSWLNNQYLKKEKRQRKKKEI